jgi:hypothetical protein
VHRGVRPPTLTSLDGPVLPVASHSHLSSNTATGCPNHGRAAAWEHMPPVIITDKVGRGCVNRPADVKAIQDALNRVPLHEGGLPNERKLEPDGNCGPKAVEAIQLFQLKQFGWPGADGKIFPNGDTHTRLNKILGPGVSVPGTQTPSTEATTEAFLIRMSTGGYYSTLISQLDTLFLTIEDAANRVSAVYRVLHYFSRKEDPVPPPARFGLPEPMQWPEPIPVGAFEHAAFHYISRTASTLMPLNLPGVARDNTMVVSLHKDAGDPAKQWFRFRRNTIMEAWKPAWDAAQEGKIRPVVRSPDRGTTGTGPLNPLAALRAWQFNSRATPAFPTSHRYPPSNPCA